MFQGNRHHSTVLQSGHETWWKENFLPENVVVELVVTGQWNHGTKCYSQRHEHLRSGIKPDLGYRVYKDKSTKKRKKFWPILSSLLHTSIGSFKENNGISFSPTLFACVTKVPANLYGLHSHLILTWENYSIPAVEEWLSAEAVGPTGLLWSYDFL